jgi:Flp pilus assembly protein TadB
VVVALSAGFQGFRSGDDMSSGMKQPAKLFRPSSIGAGASLLTVVLLMLGNPFLVLTFFVCIVYAVVPWSLWHKHQVHVPRLKALMMPLQSDGLVMFAL